MASNITPKDFEIYLPEERDTIAQGILKYVQFAILFWRWYRTEYDSDTGSMKLDFMRDFCGTGCLAAEEVVEGEPRKDVDKQAPKEDETSEDSQEKTKPPIKPPSGTTPVVPPVAGSGDCCEFVKDYKPFFFWGDVKWANLMCHQGLKCAALKNGIGYGVTLSNTGNSNFDTHASWRWWAGADVGRHVDTPLNPGFDEVNQSDEAVSIFSDVEVFLYGFTDRMTNSDGGTPPVQGNVSINNGSTTIPFKCKNNGAWGAQVLLKNWHPRGRDGFGKVLRDISIHFSRFHTKLPGSTVTPGNNEFWPTKAKQGQIQKEQPYLAYLAGVRITVKHSQQYNSDPTTPWQVGYDVNAYQVVLDERWQNDKPCYLPTMVEEWKYFMSPEAQATLWTDDGIGSGIGVIYSHEAINNWPLTFTTSKHYTGD